MQLSVYVDFGFPVGAILIFLSKLCLVGRLMGGAENCNDGFVPHSEDCYVSIIIGQYWAFKEGCGGKS